ncbi:hypothetical protein SERLA73DRAFT_87350 [Serpula lacrymans var. lacrymans S7.3]|uniref:Sacsin/Nov domain-containing protein n=2 Tax=Serpula lacrymans var. lacrymans TaxID=341189 RepID=F8PTE9_SERL3|nr:uncharacterized protein SERLADRAFT_447770 [Serpula lacrymans var. lacrymans S7.9]EGO00977.1 hypothetical protein SERLA73DRAFT_87350 [Serpula lacrymans var. lacrymans S7.3]EGO26613.1 hypothetical protein SERLADRAFT_447770 [Serpula lacrymans var. lacrymans S7.9]
MVYDKDALWETGYDESVEVNQRALIDKVLARYSGEFTVFRELLQNSDDAQSTSVEIRFETEDYVKRKSGKIAQEYYTEKPVLSDLKTTVVSQWTFRNNGMAFRNEDWDRLRKIAEGNPDEDKIGAFGVGFYSLFSVTEEPFVTSGDRWMRFYWKDNKDQLRVKRGDLPSEGGPDPWTSFEMTLREAAPIPKAFDFTRFLASSITFMAHLSDISVYFDDQRLTRLTKSTGIPKDLGLLKGLKNTSGLGIMNVKGINSTQMRIKAEVMEAVYSVGTEKPSITAVVKQSKPSTQGGFFSSLLSSFTGTTTPQRTATPLPAPPAENKNPTEVHETSVTLLIFSADVDVRLDKKMVTELNRSTKKNPPQQLKYNLIYTAKDEYDASISEEEKQPFSGGSIFQGLRADLHGSGSARVFIGHATGQTTGIGGHMATRFIPTVERESIDLVDRNVAIWNRELLYVGGFLCRTAYEMELVNIRALWEGAASSAATPDFKPDSELRAWLHNRFLHALKFFTFHPSTPSSDVSRLLEVAFFACSPQHPFSILSTAGVRSAFDVRMPDPLFASFLKQLPVLPEGIITEIPRMAASLQDRGMLKDITFMDVLGELRSRPLSEEEMIACLKWWIGLSKQGDNPNLSRIRTEFINAAVLASGRPASPDEKILPLSSVQTFINPKNMGPLIPLDGPLPDHLLPLNVSKHVDSLSLSSFGWRELSIADWIQYILKPDVLAANVDNDITKSPVWAERVLMVILRGWPNMSNEARNTVATSLKDKTCIPTSSGMRLPREAYLSSANIFKDLPIVTLPSGTTIKLSLEKILVSIGVRKHVDLQVVFDRMIKTGDWTISDLTTYLVAVQSTLTPEEVDRLRATTAFTKEEPDENSTKTQKRARYRAYDLYEPSTIFRQLKLPIIDWGHQVKWKSSSEEAKFLYRLGLRRSPPLDILIRLCSSPDEELHPIAFKYLLDNMSKYPDYDPERFNDISFIPALDGSATRLGTLKEVFANPDWASFGFLVVQPHLRDGAVSKLGIKDHPPSQMLVTLLEKNAPKSEDTARKWFSTLSGHVTAFSPSQLATLSKLPFVPVKSSKSLPDTSSNQRSNTIRWITPNQCYFGGESKGQVHSKLFVFVDFGSTANSFLSACGTKHEPSIEEIANILIMDPREFYRLADGRDNYLVELRNLAVNRRLISQLTYNRMRSSPILLGMKRTRRKNSEKEKGVGVAEWDEDDWELLYDLRKPGEIIIADDTNAYQLFGDSIFTAPQEDLLEEFYIDLGSKRLSATIREEYKTTSEIKNSKIATDVRSLILERLPLFLHEHTHTRTRISLGWLNNDKNFLVKIFGKLTVAKGLDFGEVRLTRTQDASAAAQRRGYGPIELWLSGNSQVDMYEVSTSLCRLLFDSAKVNDALLFMTILSTDLRALKRRGYNVDKILRQQQADRQAVEHALKIKAENTALISTPNTTPGAKDRPAAEVASPPPSVPQRPGIPGKLLTHEPTTAPAPTPNPPRVDSASEDQLTKQPDKPGLRPASTMIGSLQSWKRKITGHPHQEDLDGGPSLDSQVLASGHPQRSTSRPPGPADGRSPIVTPLTNIRANVDMAIKACRPEQGKLLHNRQEMQTIKESLNEGYCDTSGHVGELDLIGQMGNVKVFATRDVPEPQSIMTKKRDSLARFIHVISSLSVIYKLPMTSLHIFYDSGGGLIAFNRNASIFLNLRYFEAWHDSDVRNGELKQAQISWYFTLAHEIAHNLVQPHNSEHEFYFSALCEAHLVAFSEMLASPARDIQLISPHFTS